MGPWRHTGPPRLLVRVLARGNGAWHSSEWVPRQMLHQALLQPLARQPLRVPGGFPFPRLIMIVAPF